MVLNIRIFQQSERNCIFRLFFYIMMKGGIYMDIDSLKASKKNTGSAALSPNTR